MILLILICTLPERAVKLKRLTNILDKQLTEGVNYKVHDAGRSMSTGEKRNQLIEQSESTYFCFCDDDDIVTSDYVPLIMEAIQHNPDVITFRGFMTTNGADRRGFTIKLGSEYTEKNKHFYRFPNHLCVFKREKVRHIKFPHVWMQEDFIWADNIRKSRVLKTEYHIDKEIYHYDFTTHKPSYGPTRLR